MFSDFALLASVIVMMIWLSMVIAGLWRVRLDHNARHRSSTRPVRLRSNRIPVSRNLLRNT